MGVGVARQCSRNRCLARWTVWIPHRGRGGAAGRANSKKDLLTGRIRVSVPSGLRDLLPLTDVFLPNVAEATRITGIDRVDDAVLAIADHAGLVVAKRAPTARSRPRAIGSSAPLPRGSTPSTRPAQGMRSTPGSSPLGSRATRSLAPSRSRTPAGPSRREPFGAWTHSRRWTRPSRSSGRPNGAQPVHARRAFPQSA
jgi:hypothetical protein